MSHERGSVSLLIVALVAVTAVVVLGLGAAREAVIEHQRAQTAADAAALAGADELALGGSGADAERAARAFATANRATLIRCLCGGSEAIVTVRVGRVTRSARAIVDPCLRCGEGP